MQNANPWITGHEPQDEVCNVEEKPKACARPYFKRHTRVNKLAYSRSYAVVAAAASVVALKEAETLDDRPVAATFRPLFTQISTLKSLLRHCVRHNR